MGWAITPQLRIRRVKQGKKKPVEHLEQLWELRDTHGYIVDTKWRLVQIIEENSETGK